MAKTPNRLRAFRGVPAGNLGWQGAGHVFASVTGYDFALCY